METIIHDLVITYLQKDNRLDSLDEEQFVEAYFRAKEKIEKAYIKHSKEKDMPYINPFFTGMNENN